MADYLLDLTGHEDRKGGYRDEGHPGREASKTNYGYNAGPREEHPGQTDPEKTKRMEAEYLSFFAN